MLRNVVAAIILSILISCQSNKPPVTQQVHISADSVKQKILGLREVGFFEKYSSLSNEELYDTLYQLRKEQYAKIFEHPYDPGMDLEDHQILQLDEERCVGGDMEADVGKGNQSYIGLITLFGKASGGAFNPLNIKEEWETETGPIKVSFVDNGEQIAFSPEYEDDWLSMKVFEVIDGQMKKHGSQKFYRYLGKDGYGLGQYFLDVRMTEKQRHSIEQRFGWKFAD